MENPKIEVGRIEFECPHKRRITESYLGWEAYHLVDYQLSNARDEIKKLKKKIQELRKGKKK